MIRRSRSPAPLAALLGAAVALGACGSGGDSDDGAPPPADDPTGGASDDAPSDDAPSDDVPSDVTGDVEGGDADAATDDVQDVAPEEAPDVTAAGAGEGAGTDAGADAPGPEADGGDANPNPNVPEPDTDAADVDASAGGDALSGTASRFGLVSVVRGGGVEDGAIVAAFYGLDEALALDGANGRLLPAPDTCTFDTGADGIDADTGLVVPALDDPGLTPLSAGESVVVSGPGGTFATLQRTEALGFVVYAPEGGTVPGPIPSGLVVDVPGDEFPGFAAVSVPDAPPLTGVTPADLGGATADATFGWDAGDDPAARVIVEVALPGTDPLVSVSCSAADDGEFRLPASLLARVPDGQQASASLARVGVRALQEGDAVLLVTSGSTPD